jgi:hypothetical protein
MVTAMLQDHEAGKKSLESSLLGSEQSPRFCHGYCPVHLMQRELTTFAMLGEPRHIPNRMLNRLPVDPEEDKD